MDGHSDNPSTEELRVVQRDREAAERELADDAATPDEEHTHEARAERAAYLREKLDEQAESERE